MLRWSLYLKIALSVGSAVFSIAESNLLYLEICRFFSMFEKKLFRVWAVSGSDIKISLFSMILIPSYMRDLSECKGLTYLQNGLLSVTFFIFKFS